METQALSSLSNDELLKKRKELKNGKLIAATVIGFAIGISIYSLVMNGLKWPTFFPLALIWLMTRNSKNSKMLEAEVDKELKMRGL